MDNANENQYDPGMISPSRFEKPAWRVARSLLLAVGVHLSAWCSIVAAQQEQSIPATGKIWLHHEDEIEAFLENAHVLELKDVGHGITKPKKATLQEGDVIRHAVFKPILKARLKSGFQESYQAEVAAYRLDKVLGLGMVPPTIVRKVKGLEGSLQLWVNGVRPFSAVKGESPRAVSWSRDMSRMKTFDSLLCNRDRNLGNFLIDPSWHIILIDHSRAFLTQNRMDRDSKKLPNRFDRALMDKLKTLGEEQLKEVFSGLLSDRQIRSLLKRRDGLVAYVEKLARERGVEAVYF